jgi:hypothetical protein
MPVHWHGFKPAYLWLCRHRHGSMPALAHDSKPSTNMALSGHVGMALCRHIGMALSQHLSMALCQHIGMAQSQQHRVKMRAPIDATSIPRVAYMSPVELWGLWSCRGCEGITYVFPISPQCSEVGSMPALWHDSRQKRAFGFTPAC